MNLSGQDHVQFRRHQARLGERHVGTVERHHGLERRDRHGALAQADGERAADRKGALCAERGIDERRLDPRNGDAPVTRRINVLQVESA